MGKKSKKDPKQNNVRKKSFSSLQDQMVAPLIDPLRNLPKYLWDVLFALDRWSNSGHRYRCVSQWSNCNSSAEVIDLLRLLFASMVIAKIEVNSILASFAGGLQHWVQYEACWGQGGC